MCVDREDLGLWRLIVEFPSCEAAMQNSERPETDAMSREFAALCDGEPVFRNMDVAHSVCPGLLAAAGPRTRRTAMAIAREYRQRDDEEPARWIRAG